MWGKKKVLCPYFSAPCRKDGCAMWGNLTGHAEDGKIIDENGCIIQMNASMMLHNANMVSQQTSSLDKVANEIEEMHRTVAVTNTSLASSMMTQIKDIAVKANGSRLASSAEVKQIEAEDDRDS